LEKTIVRKKLLIRTKIASGKALAMTESYVDEEVGGVQGDDVALHSANFFHIKEKDRHCEGSARSNL
jgi:hypothetical protein